MRLDIANNKSTWWRFGSRCWFARVFWHYIYIKYVYIILFIWKVSWYIYKYIQGIYILYFNICEYNIYIYEDEPKLYIYRKCYIHIILHINSLKQNGTSYAKNWRAKIICMVCWGLGFLWDVFWLWVVVQGVSFGSESLIYLWLNIVNYRQGTNCKPQSLGNHGMAVLGPKLANVLLGMPTLHLFFFHL